MATPRIYCPQIYATGDKIRLEEMASHHILKVLRLKPGDSVVLFNGQGGEFNGKLEALDKRTVWITMGEYSDRGVDSSLDIHLIYGLARFEKTDWVIQKATELGINRITPVMTQHGEVHLKAQAAAARLARWRSIIVSACEQSGRCRLPEIDMPCRLDAGLNNLSESAKYIFHPQGNKTLLQSERPENHRVTLMVGPEGGFSEDEVSLAVQHGFKITRLGPRTLRTETAAISAVTAIQALWGDLLAERVTLKFM